MPLTIRDMLQAGAHFGHQTHRWNPKMRPYIYGVRNKIHIINLEITARLWNRAYDTTVDIVSHGGKVLFAGTKPQAQELIAIEAQRCGQYYVNRRWLGGMLTNFKTIRSRIDRLAELEKTLEVDQAQRLTKKEVVTLQKEREKLNRSLCGIREMSLLPALVVMVDPGHEHIARKEAQKLQIPILAITDTNCDPEGIDLLVPANDDALKSIGLFLHGIADACLEGDKAFERRIQEETRRRTENKPQEGLGESSGEAATLASQPVVSPPPRAVDVSPPFIADHIVGE